MTVPEMSLCLDCAEILADYMNARAGETSDSDELRTLAGHEVEALLDALHSNESLEAVTSWWARVRRLETTWATIQVIVGEFVYEEISRAEAVRTLSNSRSVSIQPASTHIWGDYEDDDGF